MLEILHPEVIEQDSVHSRIEALVEYFNRGNKSAFGRRTDIKSGVLADILGGRLNKPSFEVLRKLLTGYPQIREEWLLFGRGSMLKSEMNPHELRAYLVTARMHMEEALSGFDWEEIQERLTIYASHHEEIVLRRPAFEAVQQGLFPGFDKSEVQEYEQVLIELTTATSNLKQFLLDYVNNLANAQPDVQPEPLAPVQSTSTSATPKGFIEVPDTKGRIILIAVHTISHLYAFRAQDARTVVELTTSSDNQNISLDISLPYEEIKALIGAASR